MKSILRRRPSPALVISLIALFVSLSGVSYGVATGFIDSREIKNNEIRSLDIRNNEIRTRDLRNNEVRGIDIRNSTVQGRDVALNTLTGERHQRVHGSARCPSATAADSATTARLPTRARRTIDCRHERPAPRAAAPASTLGPRSAPLTLAVTLRRRHGRPRRAAPRSAAPAGRLADVELSRAATSTRRRPTVDDRRRRADRSTARQPAASAAGIASALERRAAQAVSGQLPA